MTPTNQALQAIGLTLEDFERRDFYRRSGRKAGAVLRSLGYRRDRMPTYAGRAVIREFKEMVKACHARGIEVILDVVFNHTAEGNEKGPSLSFR